MYNKKNLTGFLTASILILLSGIPMPIIIDYLIIIAYFVCLITVLLFLEKKMIRITNPYIVLFILITFAMSIKIIRNVILNRNEIIGFYISIFVLKMLLELSFYIFSYKCQQKCINFSTSSERNNTMIYLAAAMIEIIQLIPEILVVYEKHVNFETAVTIYCLGTTFLGILAINLILFVFFRFLISRKHNIKTIER